MHEKTKLILVKVITAKQKTCWGNMLDDGYKILYIKKPPVNGQANREAIDFLAKNFRVPKNKILLIKGAKNNRKIFKITTP
ncbi:MAG: DUF167 domain-containing protein [SAR324 cluster bacterium]|nr:DUF167 domain-containing protein [SAR324 cluster bacterium]